jgi:hypothetical protein
MVEWKFASASLIAEYVALHSELYKNSFVERDVFDRITCHLGT